MTEGSPVLRTEHLTERALRLRLGRKGGLEHLRLVETGKTDGAGTARAGMMHAAKKCMARRLREIGMNRRFGSELEAPSGACSIRRGHARGYGLRGGFGR